MAFKRLSKFWTKSVLKIFFILLYNTYKNTLFTKWNFRIIQNIDYDFLYRSYLAVVNYHLFENFKFLCKISHIFERENSRSLSSFLVELIIMFPDLIIIACCSISRCTKSCFCLPNVFCYRNCVVLKGLLRQNIKWRRISLT